MLPALRAVCKLVVAVASCQRPHLVRASDGGTRCGFSFCLTLNKWRGTNAIFWNSLFCEDFFVYAGLS
jgi:hypothetical protein